MRLSTKCYNDVSQQAAGFDGWDQVYDQLDCGHFVGELMHFSHAGLSFFHERHNLRISQSFNAPSNEWHIVIPENWCNQDFEHAGGIYIQPKCERFRSIIPGNASVVVISVPLERYPWLAANQHQLRLVKISPSDAKAVRAQLCALTAVLAKATLETGNMYLNAAQRLLDETLTLLMEESSPELQREPGAWRTSRYIVERSHQLIEQSPERPPSVLELCQHLRISRRTLQYSFQREAAVNPAHYSRALRLNAARRRLLANPAMKVSQAALEQGFTNLSYFTQQYYRLFGELPSLLHQKA